MGFISNALVAITLLIASSQALAVEEDKVKHFAVSGAIGASMQLYTEDWRTSMATCVGVGLAKELYDQYDYNGFSEKDLVADVLGCSVGVLLGDTALKVWSQDDSIGIQYNLRF